MKTKLFYLALLLSSLAYAQIPTNGIIARYDFDGGANAYQGNNATNFTQNTAQGYSSIQDRFGAMDAAINFSAVGYFYNGQNLTSTFIPVAGQGGLFRQSISFWVKTVTNSSTPKILVARGNSHAVYTSNVNAESYTIYLKNGKIHLRTIKDNSNNIFSSNMLVSDVLVSDNEWHHVLISMTESRLSTFSVNTAIDIDGIRQNSTYTIPANSGGPLIGTAKISVAGFKDTNNIETPLANRYEEMIDELIVYDRLLSSIEISNIRQSNNYCSVPSANLILIENQIRKNAVDIRTNTTYEYAFHKSSEPFANATIINNTTSGIITIPNLQEDTNYNLYIRQKCGANTTQWSASKTIKTRGKVYVNANASGNNDGTSWADAYTNLSDALTNSIDTDEIWVAGGVYNPSTSSRTTYYTIEKEDLKIYGGFIGTETQVSERIFGANETILSGDIQGDDVNVTDFIANYGNTTRNTDNSYHIIDITATGNNLLLDGLTISDAHNNRNDTERGGAIVKQKSIAKLTLKNCVVKNNVSRNDNAGLIAEFELNNTAGTRGKFIVENCVFENNMSRWASGIYSFARANTNVDIIVANTLFSGNIAGDLNSTTATGLSGSAGWFRVISNGSDVTLNLTNNTYVNNIDLGTDQSLNNISRATVAISKGSGITSTFNATVSNCVFWDNITTGGSTTRSITDLYKTPANLLLISNSIDPLSFNDDSITSTTLTANTDPLFTDPVNDDFTLSAGSPAKDTGDNNFISGSTDLLGNPRIFNTTVDMGAYEYNSTLSTDNFEFNQDEIKLYPNPTTSVLNIKMNTVLKQVSIYAVSGAEVLKSKATTINTANLKRGLYIIKIENEAGAFVVKRFVKE